MHTHVATHQPRCPRAAAKIAKGSRGRICQLRPFRKTKIVVGAEIQYLTMARLKNVRLPALNRSKLTEEV